MVGAVEALHRRFPTPISCDTWRARVLDAACSAGAVVGNDISGFVDPDYVAVAARHLHEERQKWLDQGGKERTLTNLYNALNVWRGKVSGSCTSRPGYSERNCASARASICPSSHTITAPRRRATMPGK